MLHRSAKASRSATVQIARQPPSPSLRCLKQVASDSADISCHLPSSRSSRPDGAILTVPTAMTAAVPREGRQVVRWRGTSVTSTGKSTTKGCCGLVRFLNSLPAVDIVAHRSSSNNQVYLPVNARKWKSSAASELSKDRRVSATSEEKKGELRSFRLTDVGEGILEVEVLQWFVEPGDRVRQFDKLCEVQSDKANVEITSRYDGVVRKIHWSAGDMVQTGSPLVDIEEEGEVTSPGGASTPGQVETADDSAAANTFLGASASLEYRGGDIGVYAGEGHPRRKALTTPAIRRLCRHLAIDLERADILGTGSGGRVLKGDVLAHAKAAGIAIDGIRGGDSTALTGLSGAGVMEVAETPVVAAAAAAASTVDLRQGQHKELIEGERWQKRDPVVVPIKAGVQRAMMEAMQRALEIPHMTFCDEINADRLSAVKADLQEAAKRRGVKLSLFPLIVKATSMALKAYPTLNASLGEDKSCLLQHPDHNIGVAMDTEKGLLVPCISSVQERSVLDIAEELNALQRLGAAGKLGKAELTGTTFTLSNIGSIGGTYASPLILHPQVCIGALGRMQRLPRFDSQDPDKVIPARVLSISWSADHRVVDGATLAQFSNMWKAYLENPAYMLADTR